jgi:hypothetical protein
MYTLYNTSVELNTRLATAPRPVFHCNTLLASLAINSSLLELLNLRKLLHSPNSLTNAHNSLAATWLSVYSLGIV